MAVLVVLDGLPPGLFLPPLLLRSLFLFVVLCLNPLGSPEAVRADAAMIDASREGGGVYDVRNEGGVKSSDVTNGSIGGLPVGIP